MIILLAELILLILFFVYTDKVKRFYLKMSIKLLVSIKVEFYVWLQVTGVDLDNSDFHPSLHSFVQVSENARRDLKEGLVLYTTDNNAGLKEAWDTIQGEVKKTKQNKKTVFVEMMSSFFENVVHVSHQWRCCGVTGHRDWYAALHDNVVPDPCCQRFFQGCGRNSSNTFWTRVSRQTKAPQRS